MSIYTGSGVALCTPFTPDNKFNAEVYAQLVDFQIKNGTKAIVACGTTGESSTLTTEEYIEVVKTAVAAAAGRVPVVAGAGGNNTENCVAMGKALRAAGADALMYVTPYYNKTSQRGLITHYGTIAAFVDLPIIMYNVPSRTGLNMQPKTMAELAANCPNIVGVKEASSDINQIAEVIERCGDNLDLYIGNDSEILPALALGAKGVISTMANIAPAAIQGIIDKFFEGDLAESRRRQLKILPLTRLLFKDVNPMPVKAALRLMGFDMGHCRLPLVDISDELKEELKTEMQRFSLL